MSLEQDLLTRQEHLSSPLVFIGVCFAQSFVLCVVFWVVFFLSFHTFSFVHCIVLRFTASDNIVGIFTCFLPRQTTTTYVNWCWQCWQQCWMLFVIILYLIKTILYYVSRDLRHSQSDLFSVYCGCESTWRDVHSGVLLLFKNLV